MASKVTMSSPIIAGDGEKLELGPRLTVPRR